MAWALAAIGCFRFHFRTATRLRVRRRRTAGSVVLNFMAQGLVAASASQWHPLRINHERGAVGESRRPRFLCSGLRLELLDLAECKAHLSPDVKSADFVIPAPSVQRHFRHLPAGGEVCG